MKSDDQPGDSVEAELTRVRAKKPRRADRLQYLDNEDFEKEVRSSILLCCGHLHNVDVCFVPP